MQSGKIFSLFFLVIMSVVLVAAQPDPKPVLIVLNKTDNNAAIVDPISMKVLAKIPVGQGPHEVVISEDGRTAYAANYGAQTPGNTLSIIDITSAKETRRVDLEPFYRPHGIQLIGGKLYFTAEVNRAIARYDPATDKVDWVMGTGQNGSHMIVGSRDQKRFYTTNIPANTVTMFSLQNAPPAGSAIDQIPVGNQPEAIDLSPDGKEVWVGLNAEGGIDIIDTTSKKVVERVDLGGRPYRVRFTSDGKYVVNTVWKLNEVVVVEAATRKIVRRIKVEGMPFGIDFSRDGKTAFVTTIFMPANEATPDKVLKIDLESGKILGSVETGNQPDGIAVFGM